MYVWCVYVDDYSCMYYSQMLIESARPKPCSNVNITHSTEKKNDGKLPTTHLWKQMTGSGLLPQNRLKHFRCSNRKMTLQSIGKILALEAGYIRPWCCANLNELSEREAIKQIAIDTVQASRRTHWTTFGRWCIRSRKCWFTVELIQFLNIIMLMVNQNNSKVAAGLSGYITEEYEAEKKEKFCEIGQIFRSFTAATPIYMKAKTALDLTNKMCFSGSNRQRFVSHPMDWFIYDLFLINRLN